jgi:hypothetical protein
VQLKGVTPNYGMGAPDYGQIMFAAPTTNAKYYKAMMLPDYDYITKKDRTVVFNKSAWKTPLGPSKGYDGWNFGYQCFNAAVTFVNPYLLPA